MTFGLHSLEDVLNLALWANHEGSSGYAPDLLSIHVLFFHYAEGLGHFLIGIGQQGEGQILFFLEFSISYFIIIY